MAQSDNSAPVRYTGDPNRPNDPFGGVNDPTSLNSPLNPANQKKPSWLETNGGKYFTIVLGLALVAAIVYGALNH